jgi:hypothetical protein
MLRKYKDSLDTLISTDNLLKVIEDLQNPLQTLPKRIENSNRLKKYRMLLT